MLAILGIIVAGVIVLVGVGALILAFASMFSPMSSDDISFIIFFVIAFFALAIGCGIGLPIIEDWNTDANTVENYAEMVVTANELSQKLETTEAELHNECKVWLKEYKGIESDETLTLDELVANDPELKNLLGQRLEDLYTLRNECKDINSKVNGIDEWAYWPFVKAPKS